MNVYRGVRPQRTLLAVSAWSAGRASVLAEVVVAVDRLPAEVAHEGAAAARHSVAALGLDQARGTLVALPDAGSRHLLLTARNRNGNTIRSTKQTESSFYLQAQKASCY